MSTQTETVSRISAETLAAITSAIVTGEKGAAKANARYVEYSNELSKECAKRGWDEAVARLSLMQSYVEAMHGFKFTLAKLGTAKNAATEITPAEGETATKEEIKAACDRYTFDVSKVMALAFPKAPDELKKAYAHNAPIKDYRERVGVNELLEIARGKKTLEQVLNPEKPATTPPATTTAPSGPATTPPATDGTTTTTTISGEGEKTTTTPPQSQGGGPLSFQDRFEAATAVCKSEGLTYPDAVAILDRIYGRTK